MSGDGASPAPRAAGGQEAVRDLRRRGVRGGVIAPHRAMVGARLSPLGLLGLLVWPLLGVVALAAALPWVADAWRRLFEVAGTALAIPGGVGARLWTVGPWAVPLPTVTAEAAWPGTGACLTAVALCVAALLLAAVMPGRWAPLRYFLRALVCLQASALAYFTLARPPFPHPLPDYTVALLGHGVVVMLLVPPLFGLTYGPMDVGWPRKLVLPVVAVCHLAVLLPAQALLHVYLIHRLSYLVAPVLFFAFGVLVDLFVVVAFYGWGMSAPGVSGARDRGGP